MYDAYFNLREPPFSIAPDPAYLYMSARHQEALGHLLYGTGQYGGFVQLTGEVGTGKTTIVRTLLGQKMDELDVAMIHNPRQSEAEFVESLCDELDIRYPRKPAPTVKQLVDALNAYLLKTHAAGRRTVLIIDEAQNLSPQVLEQVRLLTNLETDKEKLLRIMLVGQPELAELLARPDLRQLASRITARYHLLPLRESETREYIAHRLRVAGGAPELFSAAAMRTVHRRSGGVPRLVNVICDRALLGTYSQRLRQVTPAIVDHAASEALGTALHLDWRQRWRRRLPHFPLAWIEGTFACVGLIVAGILLQNAFGGHRSTAAPTMQKASQSKPVAATQPLVPAGAQAAGMAAADPAPAASSAAVITTAQTPAASASVKVPEVGIGILLEHSEPLGVLMGRLIALWNPALKIPAGDNVCTALAQSQLQCYRGKGQWSDLDQMNRPAILTLSLGRGGTQYVLLRHLGDDNAALDTANGSLRLSLAQLSAAWNGEFLLLWKTGTDATRIDQSSRGDDVIWLRRKLAQVNGQPAPPSPSAVFSPELRQELMEYQHNAGLDVDGVAGTQTLLSLSGAGDESGAPTLHQVN